MSVILRAGTLAVEPQIANFLVHHDADARWSKSLCIPKGVDKLGA